MLNESFLRRDHYFPHTWLQFPFEQSSVLALTVHFQQTGKFNSRLDVR